MNFGVDAEGEVLIDAGRLSAELAVVAPAEVREIVAVACFGRLGARPAVGTADRIEMCEVTVPGDAAGHAGIELGHHRLGAGDLADRAGSLAASAYAAGRDARRKYLLVVAVGG